MLRSKFGAAIAAILGGGKPPSFQPIEAEDNGVPKRLGHRDKAPQSRRRYADKFKSMIRVYKEQKSLPDGWLAYGFERWISINGIVYFIKHGTYYRLDKLARQGRAVYAPEGRRFIDGKYVGPLTEVTVSANG